MITELGDELPFDLAIDDRRRIAGANLNWPQAVRQYRTYVYLRLSGPGAVASAAYNLIVLALLFGAIGLTARSMVYALVLLFVLHPWSPGSVWFARLISSLRRGRLAPATIWRLEPSGPVLYPAGNKPQVSWASVKSYASQGDVLVLNCGKLGYGLTPVEGGLTMTELVDVVYGATGLEPRQLNGVLYRLAFGVTKE